MKFISSPIMLALSLATAVLASPTANVKRDCVELHCSDADPSTCCSDHYGYCNTDTGDCHCGRDCFPWNRESNVLVSNI
ncbi:hypothetical protein BJX99DRAFT_254903 [Aspergillus californicus]